MITRYFGIDIHKEQAMIAAVDAEQTVIEAPFALPMTRLAAWASKHLTESDAVTFEATTNAWHVYDTLADYAGQVVVVNPYKTRLIAEARIKTDKVDALALAQLLAAHFTCEVWVPPVSVRQQRALASHRITLRRQLTQTKNRLHGLLQRHNLTCPSASLFSHAGRAWLETVPLSPVDSLQRHHLLTQLDSLQEQFDETDRFIARLACQDLSVARLMQVPGVGYFTAFAVLAIIGDIHRFATPQKLSAYAGLVPSRHQSGARSYNGSITKAGSPPLRWLMVEAAHCAVRWDPHWQRVHHTIARRRGPNVATVAVARKLLVVFWHLLQGQAPYYHLQPQSFVTKLQTWAFAIGREHLPAQSSADFVYERLRALDLPQVLASLTKTKKGKLRFAA